MNTSIHEGLAGERWFKLSVVQQMANVGSDVLRTIKWKQQGCAEDQQAALFRALELMEFTIEDPKNRKRLKELCRVREALIDYFMFDNEYQTSDEYWYNYFFDFNYAAALERGR